MKPTPSLPLSPEAAYAAPVAATDAQVGSPLWSVAFFCSLAGLFILYSRFFDFAANGFRIPRIVLSLMILLFLLSGRTLIFLRSTTGKLMFGFLFWVSFTLIFSVWKGGSLPPYLQLLQSTVIFAIAAGLPMVVGNVKRLMSGLAVSGLVAALMSIPWGTYQLGRLALREGSYLDPNYYALALLAIMPFFWSMAASSESLVGKVLGWAGMVPLVVTLARTGSRGAMMGFAVMLVLLFLISPVKTKIFLAAATALGIVAMLAVMPSYIRTRYLTFFEVDSSNVAQQDGPIDLTSDINRLRADASSAGNRKRLLFTSIDLTFKNPVVGVGPGNFPTAVYDASKASGQVRNEWLVTHNSYTQISSETGIPGFILFVCILLSALRNLTVVLKKAKETGAKPDALAHSTAKYLLLSMAAVCVSVFFLAVGYEFTIFLLAGLTVSLRRTFEQQPAALEVEPVLSVPAPRQTFTPAYARVEIPATKRETAMVSGRAVRFGRFR